MCFTIGCDPEPVVCNNGVFVKANKSIIIKQLFNYITQF